MANLGGFRPEDHEDPQEFDALPAGWYEVQIVKSEIRTSKKNSQNAYLWLEFIVGNSDGFDGRKMWAILNVWSTNPQAARIGSSELRQLCIACGRLQGAVEESEELHNIPIMVKTKPEAGEKGDQTKIIKYAPINDQPRPAPGQSAPPQPSAPPQSRNEAPPPGGAGPWKGRAR